MKSLDETAIALAASQHGVFTRAQAVAAGAPGSACDRRLRTGLWRPTRFAGVYFLVGQPESWLRAVMAAVLAAPEGTVASHRTAAVLMGLREGTPIEVTVPRSSQSRLQGVLVHQSVVPAVEQTTMKSISTPRVERTLIDLSGVVAEKAVEHAVEAALRLGLTSAERVEAYLEASSGPGRRGATQLRQVLERRGEGRPTGSALEVEFLQLLRSAGVEEPARQYEVCVGGNRYFLDFAYPQRRLAIELDGRAHHSFAADRQRQNALVLAGWTVLRFTWADVVTHGVSTVAAVSCALEAA